MLKSPNSSEPVESGRTRTTVPSLTCNRNGHRDWQFAKHAFHTIVDPSPPVPDWAASAALAAGMPSRVTAGTSAAAPPTAADHFRNVRLDGPAAIDGPSATDFALTVIVPLSRLMSSDAFGR